MFITAIKHHFSL